MRRLLAIALFFLVSFPLISPLFALTGGPQANLPACCRRNGAHHCMGTMRMPDSADQTIKLAPPAAALLFAEVVGHPAVRPQVQARARVSLDRSRHKRGPPVTLL